jgi:arylsulfatase A-like enzyme
VKEPFFLYAHTRDPHQPYDPPAAWRRFSADAARARPVDLYDDEIRFNDHYFGELVERLEERGLYRDSMLVLTSDHGEEFGERGGSGHGFTLFEEVVRVPLVVKYPGNAGAGTSVEAPVSLLDVLPTVLATAGLPVPPGRRARSSGAIRHRTSRKTAARAGCRRFRHASAAAARPA